jgi:D-glycero-D-manno-heptose 1,7-bisphosphate phosphatase
MTNKAVFLDRDGTLNQALIRNGKPFPPISPRELVILPGVKEALVIFVSLDFIPVVITNQPDFARGITSRKQIDSLNEIIRTELKIEHIYTCFHDDSDDCFCRKPKPGLLLTASKELNLDLKESILVGDRWKDVHSGQTVGCECYFIDNKYEETQPNQPFIPVASLLDSAYKVRSRSDF